MPDWIKTVRNGPSAIISYHHDLLDETNVQSAGNALFDQVEGAQKYGKLKSEIIVDLTDTQYASDVFCRKLLHAQHNVMPRNPNVQGPLKVVAPKDHPIRELLALQVNPVQVYETIDAAVASYDGAEPSATIIKPQAYKWRDRISREA